jgi:hypothetical protein
MQLLIALRDGRLEPAAMTAVSDHLRECAECRGDFQQLCTETPVSQADLQLLAGLRDQIGKWDALRHATPDDRAQQRRNVAAALAPFIGEVAARKLLEGVSEDGRNLLSTLEPVLARFLGSSAASELVSHLVDSAIY